MDFNSEQTILPSTARGCEKSIVPKKRRTKGLL